MGAAKAQSVSLPAQDVAASIVAELAKDVLGLKGRLESIDEELQRRFFARPEARILTSLPGMGPISSGPSFWWPWATSAPSLVQRGSPPMLVWSRRPVTPASEWATTVGCEEATRSSSGFSTSRRLPACAVPPGLPGLLRSQEISEGKRHTQALIALARRRVNVVWAMLRDGTTFETRSAA